MGTYTSVDIGCPFYRRDDPKTSSLTCEGVLPGSTVKSHFGSRDNMQKQVRKYCAGDFKACPWYKVAYLKWIKTED